MIPKILSRLVTATLLALTVATHLHAETVTVRGLEVIDGAQTARTRSAASRARTRRGTDPSYSSRTCGDPLRGGAQRGRENAHDNLLSATPPLGREQTERRTRKCGGARHFGYGTRAISFEGRHRVAQYTARGIGVSAATLPGTSPPAPTRAPRPSPSTAREPSG